MARASTRPACWQHSSVVMMLAGTLPEVALRWRMFILGVGTASPTRRYTQAECWEVAQRSEQIQRLSPRSRALLRKVLTGKNGIEARHLVLDHLGQVFDVRPDALHA